MRPLQKSSSSTSKQNSQKGNGNTETEMNPKFSLSKEDELRNTLVTTFSDSWSWILKFRGRPIFLLYLSLTLVFNGFWIPLKIIVQAKPIYHLSSCFVYVFRFPPIDCKIWFCDSIFISFPVPATGLKRGNHGLQVCPPGMPLIPSSFCFLPCKWRGVDQDDSSGNSGFSLSQYFCEPEEISSFQAQDNKPQRTPGPKHSSFRGFITLSTLTHFAGSLRKQTECYIIICTSFSKAYLLLPFIRQQRRRKHHLAFLPTGELKAHRLVMERTS